MRLRLRVLVRLLVAGLLLVATALTIAPFSDTPAAEAQPGLCPPTTGWAQIPRLPAHPDPAALKNDVASVAEDWHVRGRLYSAAVFGAYASGDCGRTWEQVHGLGPPLFVSYNDVAIAADSEGRTYVAGGAFNTLAVGANGASSWELVQRRGDDFRGVARRGLSVSATGRLYVETASSNSVSNAEGLHFTDDGGSTWTQTRRFQSPPATLAADPIDRTVLYGSLSSIYPNEQPHQLVRSTDSGATFQPWSEVQEFPGAIGVSVDGSRFWFASYGQHLWQSRDGGQSWQIVDTMPFTGPVQLVGSPHDPRVVYAVSEDGNIWAYRETGAATAPIQLPAGR